jgi:hypothetical protein
VTSQGQQLMLTNRELPLGEILDSRIHLSPDPPMCFVSIEVNEDAGAAA